MKKRILSMFLALACVFSSSIPALAVDSATFTDVSEIQHQEAVTALCLLEVVNGKDDGAFHPSDTVTRAEAAKLIVLILNGGRDFVQEETDEYSFSDIQDHWAKNYIEYCTKLGIISGQGDGTFNPDGEVTKFQLLKMAEVMLGYSTNEFHLTGPYWWIVSHDLAIKIGLYTDLSEFPTEIGETVSDEPLTRDSAAQILYNALSITPYIETVTHIAQDGSVRFESIYATNSDGTPRTLLQDCFGLNSLNEAKAK